jgi:acyl-CoA thioesterase-1
MPGWTVVNAGISGDTTAGGLRRIRALLTDEVGVLVVALGANDGLRGVDIDIIESNLSRIIQMAQVCGLETIPTAGFQYALEFHRLYPRLESRHDVPLVPFLLAGVALNPEMNGPDRIHPNAAGAQRIAETVWPYLAPLLAEAGDGGRQRTVRASAADCAPAAPAVSDECA